MDVRGREVSFSASLSFLTLVLVQHKACMYSPQKLSDDISLNKDYGGLLSTNLCEVVFLPYLTSIQFNNTRVLLHVLRYMQCPVKTHPRIILFLFLFLFLFFFYFPFFPFTSIH